MNREADCLTLCGPAAWHRDMYREASPAGNGIVGVLVYGGIYQERLAVNHCRLWQKGVHNPLPDVKEALVQTREAIDRGDYEGGNWCSANALKEQGYTAKLGNPVPLCDICLETEDRKLFKQYRRRLHMDSGEVEITWKEQQEQFSRKLFVSRKRDMIFYRVEADGEPVTMKLWAERHETFEDDTKGKWPEDGQKPVCFAEGNAFGFSAQHEDESWYGLLGRIQTDGTVHAENGVLTIEKAKWMTVAAKCYVEENAAISVNREVFEEDVFDYSARLAEHCSIHEALYRSVSLSFESEAADSSNERLLEEAYEDVAPVELLEKQWKFGRYLLICGTREDGLPFPLYGLWHGRYRMPWPHNMANENVEMIYWHTYAGNLYFSIKTLIHYYFERIPNFRECAKKLFGLPGIYVPAGTTPENSLPTQIVPVILNWIGCAGWLSSLFYQYYTYTRDEELLEKEILPFMLEAAAFYEHYIQWDASGQCRIYPSVSPENTPGNLIPKDNPNKPHPCPSVENATMDIAIIKELFTNLNKLSDKLDGNRERVESWKNFVRHMPPYDTHETGDVREWQKEGLEPRYEHRHLSHLYPVFPGTEIVKERDDEKLVNAFEKAVDLRVLGAQSGWSLAHMSCVYARLERPERAIECLDILAKACLHKNLFTLHNDWRGMGLTLGKGSGAPVQLDAAMGVVNVLQEMLLFSGEDCLKLLPALPKRLGKGHVEGMRFMQGTVSMKWDMQKKFFAAELVFCQNAKLRLYLPEWAKQGIKSLPESEIIEYHAGESLKLQTTNQ